MPTSRRKPTPRKDAPRADRARTASVADEIVLTGPPGRLHATV